MLVLRYGIVEMTQNMSTDTLPQRPQSATLIADYLLSHSEPALTMLHVMKLTYISHGWHLAIFNGKPLIGDDIEAWRYGPVIPTLYRNLKLYGRENITKLIYCGTSLSKHSDIDTRKSFIEQRINPDSQRLINKVLDEYSDLTAMQLSALTHQVGTPWSKCYIEGQLFTTIPNHIIQKHYVELAKEKLIQ